MPKLVGFLVQLASNFGAFGEPSWLQNTPKIEPTTHQKTYKKMHRFLMALGCHLAPILAPSWKVLGPSWLPKSSKMLRLTLMIFTFWPSWLQVGGSGGRLGSKIRFCEEFGCHFALNLAQHWEKIPQEPSIWSQNDPNLLLRPNIFSTWLGIAMAQHSKSRCVYESANCKQQKT